MENIPWIHGFSFFDSLDICPLAGRAFTLCLQLQRVNRESRRCACSPKNYHYATLEAMNSVRELSIMVPTAF